MTTQAREVSVTLPVGQAIDRVKKVLFQPFDAARWFVIGFCAWLAYLGEGGGFPSGFHFGGHHGHGAQSLHAEFEQARDYVLHNLAWILPLAIALIVASMAVWLILMWLSSRGRFMFLHCVAHNTAEVRVPWVEFAPEANSLFVFRLLISLISLVLMLPLVGALVLVVLGMVSHNAVSPAGLLLAIALLFVIIAFGMVFWIIARLTRDFVVPLQFLHRSRVLDAWRELGHLLRGNFANLVLYLLFRIVLAIAITVLVVFVVLATCCIAGCLFALPYLGTVFLLPILVFERAYSLHYLAQFGPDYDVFAPPATGVSGMPSA
jgi:hypothetical protein